MCKDLYWLNNHTPASRRHDDIYFSSGDGLRESRFVFLKGISAPEIWQQNNHFTLLENGFGTGLNFIMTCHQWLNTTSNEACMTYIATEKYPLLPDDVNHILSHWHELDRERRELLAKYPPPIAGFHSRELFGGRVKLLLLSGDSTDSLPRLDATVDAFYLDGFSPNRNPDMWSGAIFTELARLAAPKARLATFSAAGFVRRGLENVGFSMTKAPGFGKKRECLRGEFRRSASPATPATKPWFDRPPPVTKGSSIAVIGGGIAGLTAGLALQKNGYEVTIFEHDNQPMNRASGNPAGILDPGPCLEQSIGGEFYRAALITALDYFSALGPEIFSIRGMTKFPTRPGEKDKFQALLKQKILPPEMMVEGPNGSLHFPRCGAISPPLIRQIFRRELSITTGRAISRIDHDHHWKLYNGNKVCHEADAVILCGGPASIHFPETNHLPLMPVRGQITLLNAEKYTDAPANVLCGRGYLVPPVMINATPTMITGSSFSRNDSDCRLRSQDHEDNIEKARRLSPNIDKLPIMGGRCAIRAHSPDHLPLCGPIADFAGFQAAYGALKHGPGHQNFQSAHYQPNLYTISGLGAHGFLTSPILAEILLALITAAPLPVPESVYHALHPARFIIRKLRKAK